jgi:hypothetical protein
LAWLGVLVDGQGDQGPSVGGELDPRHHVDAVGPCQVLPNPSPLNVPEADRRGPSRGGDGQQRAVRAELEVLDLVVPLLSAPRSASRPALRVTPGAGSRVAG